MKNVSTDTDRSMLPNQEVTVTKEKVNKKVSWDKKVNNSKEEGSKIVALQSADGSTEKKRESIETSRASKNFTKPATFDGTSSWIDYRSHFEMCAELNNWTNQQKGLYLGVSLRGLAQGVLGNLSVEDQKTFEALSKALSESFSPERQTELYRAQLKEREWKHGENVTEFAQRILRLTTLSWNWPKADKCVGYAVLHWFHFWCRNAAKNSTNKTKGLEWSNKSSSWARGFR